MGKRSMAENEKVLVVDFGGQYNQLIARRVRECNVYCEIDSYWMGLEAIRKASPVGIILTGGPNSVYLDDSPSMDSRCSKWESLFWGFCYGSQLMMHLLGWEGMPGSGAGIRQDAGACGCGFQTFSGRFSRYRVLDEPQRLY